MTLDIGDEILPFDQRSPIDPENLVATLKPGLLGRAIGQHLRDPWQHGRKDPRIAKLVLGHLFGGDLSREDVATPVDLELEGVSRRGQEGELNLVPVVDGGTVDLEDPITPGKAGSLTWGALGHGADHRLCFGQTRDLDPGHQDHRNQDDCQNDIHRRSGQIDHNPLPAWLVEEVLGVVGDLGGVLTTQPDVAAQGHDGDAIVGLSPSNSPDLLAKSERKGQNPDPKGLGHQQVSRLVDKDDDPQGEDKGGGVAQNVPHTL